VIQSQESEKEKRKRKKEMVFGGERNTDIVFVSMFVVTVPLIASVVHEIVFLG
jgi:hypothetical protein